MGDYTEHLISMAGGDGDDDAERATSAECDCDAVVGHHNGCASRFVAIDRGSATLTDEAVSWLMTIAEEAAREIAALPAGSQPFWFRTRAAAMRSKP